MNTQDCRLKILLIEDNPGDFRLIQEMFKESKANVELKWAKQLSTGLANLKEEMCDGLLVDLGLSDCQGIDAFKKIRDQAPQIPIIVLTSLADDGLALRAVREGAQDYLVKGQTDSNLLLRAIHHAIERKRTEEALRESEARYRSLFENAVMGIFQTTPEGRYLSLNMALARMFGFESSEEMIMSIENIEEQQYVNREDRKRLQKLYEEQGYLHGFETQLYRKDGGTIWIAMNARVIRDDKGKSLYYEGTTEDITERKRAEEALRQSEERFRLSFENANIGVCLVDLKGRFIRVNERMCEIFGYSREELEDMTVKDIAYPEDVNFNPTFIQPAVSGEIEHATFVKRYFHKQGHLVWGKVSSSLIRDAKGLPLNFISHVEDITRHKEVEDALKESEKKFKELFDEAPVGYHELDKEGRIIQVNKTELEMLGYTAEEVLGHPVWTLMVEEEVSRKALTEKMSGLQAPGRQFERTYRKKDGTILPVLIEDRFVRDSEGKITGIRSTILDITERKKAEEEVRKSRLMFQDLFDRAPVGYFETDQKGLITRVNRTELELLGYSAEEMVGRAIWDFSTEKENVRQLFFGKLFGKIRPEGSYERCYLKKDGTSLPVSSDDKLLRNEKGKITGMRVIIRDITERKEAEKEMALLQEQLRQSQKMEAVGRLAGGIAHDFNNLLTIIKGYSQLLRMEEDAGGVSRESLNEIQLAADGAANLTRQLLAFSRRQVLDLRVLDLNTVLRGLYKMLSRLIGEDIELVMRLPEDLGRVKTDPGWMEQVIMNLAVNARDAMPSGGKLTIETANVELDDEYARWHVSVAPGPYVMLSVSDTGVGMTREVREQIFEPFYTTKEKGKGTGLGLSTVYGIVKQSGGNVWVYSEPGEGTVFKIYLPRIDEPVEIFVKKEELKEVPRGNETVLVVEDAESVRKLVVRVLRKQGYHVLEAPQGQEALLACECHRGPIHLVVTDVVMPGMAGPEMVGRLRQVRQELKVIYMSGYTDDPVVRHGVLEGEMDFVQKPFTVESLAHKVREVLDRDWT